MKLFQSIAFGLAAWALPFGAAAEAQVQQIDPNTAIDGDLQAAPATPPPAREPAPATSLPAAPRVGDPGFASPAAGPISASEPPVPGMTSVPAAPPRAAADGNTYREDDLIGAAEGVFGKGAKGLALMIQDILKKQGQPNAYITGREAGGAVVVGVRYGSGTLHHKIEGERPVYWTGPSIGFDVGANAANTFVLVYNLHDSEDLFRRYGAGEGQAYFVGGFNVSYLRRGDVVLIPVRFGAGLRLGVNGGYMKFRRTQNWVPF
ncbi:hypothetical protein AQZ52_14350 [Novosphingobium fuchskuhlense]|uniref:DUF1134 domain-containing protein n=1 Tax=Novosphingobium fuchskuhlense TaxID=1117702 RepID=A0A117USI0_9SPHN|nr:DUF1134 domain-containing protein [Novosphingobium fuchskuhlense]KUR70056.1 hypothetical protein AQZ52_14350 [Novosphingobium fuchskuhlense]